MTTTTSTTTSTAANAKSAATSQLLGSLNAGSGVDTTSLVSALVTAEFAARTDALKNQNDTLTAQLSGVSTLKSAISQFGSALDTLTRNGTLGAQLASSDTGVLTVAATDAAKVVKGSHAITVNRLAAEQTARTTDTSVTSRATRQFSGTLTVTVGQTAVGADGSATTTGGRTTSITLANASLDEVARAITASNTGITASVVTDADGTAYLSMKGAPGAANGFTIATADDAATGKSLALFAVGDGSGARATGQAADADLTVDGIHVTRGSNAIADLIDGASVTLTRTGTATLSATPPDDALSQAVTDVVDTYNQVLATVTAQTNPKDGALRNDPAARALLHALQQLTATPILSHGAANDPVSLSQIGVATNRDGTLRVDSATFAKALKAYPDAIKAMFAPATTHTQTTATGSVTTATGDGLSAALINLVASTTNADYGLGRSEVVYTKQQGKVAAGQDDLTDRATAETARLTQQFASMNSKVSAYKSTQTFLTNQIAAWNKSDS